MNQSNKYQSLRAKENFISNAPKIHNNKYIYNKVKYINANTKVEIICPTHGSFWQIPRFHIRKNNPSGCPKCANNINYTTSEFIQKANKKHNNKYDYSLVNYKTNNTKIIIICLKHGKFKQTPANHLYRQGCPKCKSSKGELKIESFLIQNNIPYNTQHTFNKCRGKKRPLPFDFYLPIQNTCIEFQGEQHFRPAFGIKPFKKTQRTDIIKEQYCQNNNIQLLKINYNEQHNINNILQSFFNSF